MKKKIKLRDLSKEQYIKWFDNYCQFDNLKCSTCQFGPVNCSYIDPITCWINNKELYSDKFLDQEIEIEIEMPKLTMLEKGILKNIDDIEDYKYIGRNKDGDLYASQENPFKGNCCCNTNSYIFCIKIPFKNLFQFIKLEDEEPYLIEDLLRED